MKIVSDFPRPVREIENLWIPLADGIRLAARLFLPEDSEQDPVPAILDLVPYRKRDHYRLRDDPMYRYLAGHGYAAIRVDARGTGESDGVILGEFLKQEQDDGIEIVAWLAAQPWCSGAVAMQGLSWGGFSALQIAARRPPALKAIIVVGASDDRYDGSLHYTGGCLLNEQLWVSAYYMLVAMRPPDPAIVGDAWRSMWRQRLDANAPWIADWLTHPHRDAFWEQGSIREDWRAIRCPVFAVSGWADYLSPAVPRLLANLDVPRRGVIGPWGHVMPHQGEPGEPYGFLQDCVRWYDRWLKGIDNGVDREPLLQAFMQEALPPQADGLERKGRWIVEDSWPSPGIEQLRWHLNPRGLDAAAAAETEIEHLSPQTVGLGALEWSSRPGAAGQEPGDQRIDDGRSLSFDTAPLDEPLEMLGAGELELTLAVDRPVAFVFARLNDVAPDGVSTRVAFKALNLAHRDGSKHPRAMPIGEPTRIRLTLPDQAYRFAAGHRIRIALSTTYWPILWPSPHPVRLTLVTGASTLALPVRQRDRVEPPAPPLQPAEQGTEVPVTVLEPATLERRVERDVLTGETIVSFAANGGFYGPGALYRIDPIGTEIGHRITKRFGIRDDAPLSAWAEIAQSYSMGRGDWQIAISLTVAMRASETEFEVTTTARAEEGGAIVYERSWPVRRRRDLS